MAATASASRLVTAAARDVLRPLGLTQRGRSRIWIDDHGWWLGVVEFTPPRTAGSSLTVGAMWLWHDIDHLAFNTGGKVADPESFHNEAQFAPRAADLAHAAAESVAELRARFTDLAAVAEYLTTRPVRRGFLRDGLDTGVAAGLVGNAATARQRFDRMLEEEPLAPWMVHAQDTARMLHRLAPDPQAMTAWATRAIRSCRDKLQLGPASLSLETPSAWAVHSSKEH
jgi:hypothetical protein